MSEEAIERTVQLLEKASVAMTKGAKHCRIAQTHFRNREWARAAAHSWAANGQLIEARRQLDKLAEDFASRSNPVDQGA